MHFWWVWYFYFYISFINSFEECRSTWRGDGGEFLPLFNPSIPQSCRDQYKAVPIKANWFAKCFCSEGTSPIFSNKEVLGRGGRHTSEGQIWNEAQNTEESGVEKQKGAEWKVTEAESADLMFWMVVGKSQLRVLLIENLEILLKGYFSLSNKGNQDMANRASCLIDSVIVLFLDWSKLSAHLLSNHTCMRHYTRKCVWRVEGWYLKNTRWVHVL